MIHIGFLLNIFMSLIYLYNVLTVYFFPGDIDYFVRSVAKEWVQVEGERYSAS